MPREYAEIKVIRDNNKCYLGYTIHGKTVLMKDVECNQALPNYKVCVALYGAGLRPRFIFRCEGSVTEDEDGFAEFTDVRPIGKHPVCSFMRSDSASARRRYARAAVPPLLSNRDTPIGVPSGIPAYTAKPRTNLSAPLETYADMYATLFKI